MYKVVFSKNALKQLQKLDKATAALIVGWIKKNLDSCENPRISGKALSANLSGLWRYRVGDYRIIAQIIDTEIVIFVVNIGHRRDIYDAFK